MLRNNANHFRFYNHTATLNIASDWRHTHASCLPDPRLADAFNL